MEAAGAPWTARRIPEWRDSRQEQEADGSADAEADGRKKTAVGRN